MSNGFFFLTVFFFLFAAWIAGGGPNRPISFAGPFITPITNVGVTQTGYGSLDGFQISAVKDALYQANQQLSDAQKQANKDALFGVASPYKGQITIGSANAGATDPSQQYIYLRNSSSKSITLSGWRIASAATDKSATIPYGDPLPGNGSATASTPITLGPGQQAVLVTGQSPLGASFLENSCLGYLDRNRTYVPYLPQNCPSPRDEYDRYYTGNQYKDASCYALVQKLNSCQTPETSSGLSSSCYAFIDQHLNYPACVASHRYDPNFQGSTWRVYLDYHNPSAKNKTVNDLLWRSSREAIKLLDADGKTVDLYSY